MKYTCVWCRAVLDTSRHPFVQRIEKLANGLQRVDRFHPVCSEAYRQFLEMHAFQPLDPSLHQHE